MRPNQGWKALWTNDIVKFFHRSPQELALFLSLLHAAAYKDEGIMTARDGKGKMHTFELKRGMAWVTREEIRNFWGFHKQTQKKLLENLSAKKIITVISQDPLLITINQYDYFIFTDMQELRPKFEITPKEIKKDEGMEGAEVNPTGQKCTGGVRNVQTEQENGTTWSKNVSTDEKNAPQFEQNRTHINNKIENKTESKTERERKTPLSNSRSLEQEQPMTNDEPPQNEESLQPVDVNKIAEQWLAWVKGRLPNSRFSILRLRELTKEAMKLLDHPSMIPSHSFEEKFPWILQHVYFKGTPYQKRMLFEQPDDVVIKREDGTTLIEEVTNAWFDHQSVHNQKRRRAW